MAKIAPAALILLAGLSAAHAEKITLPPQPGPVIAEVLGQEVRKIQEDEIVELILGPLLHRYAAEKKISATKEEIAAFQKKSRLNEAREEKKWAKERKDFQKRLQSPALSDAERKSLQTQLASIDTFLASTRKGKTYARQHRKEMVRMERDIAVALIQSWKVNQALFQQHGGRVVMAPAGPEPLGAYQAFLKAEEKKGSFKILNKNTRADFWDYFTDDHVHDFLSPAEGEKLFRTPWWLQEDPPADKR